jgi:hypothetical protein
MLTSFELEQLCLEAESPILDFKESFYEFGRGDDDKGTAAFVKDIMAMVNTVRSQPAYLVFGIKQVIGQAPIFIGISQVVDDAILQDKIKSKLNPRPEFLFYSLRVKEVTIAVLEFPVRKYATPISSTVKLKGIEPGKIYHRQGSSNTEALGNEVIHIYEWMKSLPDIENESQKDTELSQLLIQTADSNIALSTTIAAIFNFAKKYRLEELAEFCRQELNGLDQSDDNGSHTRLKYRVTSTFVTYSSITVNLGMYSISQLKDTFRKEESLTEAKVLLSQSISAIENIINNFGSPDSKKLATMKISSKEFLPNSSIEHPLTIYLFPDDMSNLYTRIRQEAIRLLMKA